MLCPFPHDTQTQAAGGNPGFIESLSVIGDAQFNRISVTAQYHAGGACPGMLGYIIKRLLGNAV
jgi:hypothetical protein